MNNKVGTQMGVKNLTGVLLGYHLSSLNFSFSFCITFWYDHLVIGILLNFPFTNLKNLHFLGLKTEALEK